MNLKEFAQALVARIKGSGAISAEVQYGGYCDTCAYEWAEVQYDDSQLDADIDALCAEFAARNSYQGGQ